jgi:serine/threonine protein kinase/lipoprotein NlpI
MAVLDEKYWQSFVGETIRGNTAWSNVYHIQEFLGRGGFGGVFKAQQDDTKELVAVKLMLPADDGAREIKTALKVPAHPNLIKHIDAIDATFFGKAKMYVLVMELADGGSLRDLLDQRNLDGVEARKIAIDIVEGLKHLHSIDATGSEEKKLVHRDMKPENILQVKGVWKIADFGLAKVLENGSMQASEDAGGTPQYMPPEFLQHPNIVSTKWDIWSFGVILAEMLARERPFDSYQPDANQRKNDIYRKILAAKPNIPNVPKEWLPIVQGCLIKKHKSRWTADKVLDILKTLTIELQPKNNVNKSPKGLSSEPLKKSLIPARKDTISPKNSNESTRKAVVEEENKTKRQGLDKDRKSQASFKIVFYTLVVIGIVFTGVMNRHFIPLIHGDILNKSGNKKDALAKYQEAISIKPDYSYAYFWSAYVKSDLGDKQGAIADYTESIRLKPDYSYAYYNRAFAKSNLGDDQGALADFTEAIRLKPDDADAYYNRGFVKKYLGDKQGSIADFTEAIRIEPDNTNFYYSRANLKNDLGDKLGAVADFTKLIRLIPDYHRYYLRRGELKKKLGDKLGALSDYNESLRLNPNFIDYIDRGELKKELGDKQGALSDYNESLRLNSGSYRAYAKRGIVKYELGDKEGALTDYNKYLSLGSNSSKLYYYRGVAKDDLRDKQGAITDYNQAIEINKNWDDVNLSDAYYNRGNAKKDLGNKEGAIADYNEAIRLKSDYADPYYNRGLIKKEKGEKQEALADFRKALELYQQKGNTEWSNNSRDRIKELGG